jgi:hypothetical protein
MFATIWTENVQWYTWKMAQIAMMVMTTHSLTSALLANAQGWTFVRIMNARPSINAMMWNAIS